jgi:hypothetical protein
MMRRGREQGEHSKEQVTREKFVASDFSLKEIAAITIILSAYLVVCAYVDDVRDVTAVGPPWNTKLMSLSLQASS